MTDIVDRLREYSSEDHERGCQGRCYSCECGYDDRRDPLIKEAADEIETLRGDLLTGNSELLDQAEIENRRLRAEVERLKALFIEFEPKRLRAEVERLRGALKEIATHRTHPSAEVARAALGEHTACKCEPGYTDPMCPEVE